MVSPPTPSAVERARSSVQPCSPAVLPPAGRDLLSTCFLWGPYSDQQATRCANSSHMISAATNCYESGFPEIRISGNPDIRNAGLPDCRISRYPEIRISGNPDIRISGYPDFRQSGAEIRISGFPEIRISGNPDIRKSGFPDNQISGFSEVRESGHPDFTLFYLI